MSSIANESPTSVPISPHGKPCLAAMQCILVTQSDGQAELDLMRSELAEQPIDHLSLKNFSSIVLLQREMKGRLSDAQVGVRLVLQGDEAFVWPLHALARTAGFTT